MKQPPERNGQKLVLPAIADLAAAEGLRDSLLAAVAAGAEDDDLILGAAGVERISTACIQVILSAQDSLAGSGRRIRLDQPSEAVRDAFDRLGLAADFKTLT